MPEIYSELSAPTAVTHSLRSYFTSRRGTNAPNLIVAKTTLLQIFTLKTNATEILTSAMTSAASDRHRSTFEDVTRLVLLAEYPLHGQVSGMVAVQRDGAADALLLSFREAKASVLVWDADAHAIQTVSLHYYERQEFYSPVVVAESLPTELVVDPGNRAALLRFAGDVLAVWPVWQSGEEDLLDDGDTKMTDGGGGGGDADTVEPKKEKAKKEDQIFHPSFVIKAGLLDDSISHVISLRFLHEYREPTLGILYSPKRTWTGWLEERKDTVCYIVITLDLEQRACTPIMSVQNLPYDLFKVVAVNAPIGGSLLLGTNQLIHVDQAGKTTGVAVNPYYRKATNFGGLADQSDLCLELEGAAVVELENENGDMLLIMKDGTAVIIGFRMDGRNVSGVRISKIANHAGPLVGGVVTSATLLGDKRLFISCSEGDARILRWKRMGAKKLKPAAPKLSDIPEDELSDVDVEALLSDSDDDDLYGGPSSAAAADLSGAPRKDSIFPSTLPSQRIASLDHRAKGEYLFQTHDRLINLAPLTGLTLGRPVDVAPKHADVAPELEIVAACGPSNTPEDAGLVVLRQSLAPTVVGSFELPAARALWAVRTRTTKGGPTTGAEEQRRSAEEEYGRYLFVSKASESAVYRIADEFEEVRGTDFEAEGETVEAGCVADGGRVVHVVPEQVRVYDCDMQLAQIIPMVDADGEDGPAIVKAKVCDPYLVLLRVDGSVNVHKLDKNMEMAEQDVGPLKEGGYASGSIYQARKGQFSQPQPATLKQEDEGYDYILTLMNEQGALEMYDLTDLTTPLFTTSNFGSLPPLLKAGAPAETRTEDITEVLLADLGDHVTKSPYLFVRNGHDDITIYTPFFTSTGALSFLKLPNPVLATPRTSAPPDADPSFLPLTAAANIGGLATVFLPGADPAFIIATSHSLPRLHRLAGPPVRSCDAFHTASADRGFISLSSTGTIRVCHLPAASDGWSFATAFAAKKIYLNESLRGLAWYDPMRVYAATTVRRVPFSLAEDGETPPDDPAPPHIDASDLVLINPANGAWRIVDRWPFAPHEAAHVVAAPSLEVSETTHERRTLITVGTGLHRGEDASARGAVYVFEVIDVVPEPGRPETNRKLKLLVREEVKGTVSALTGVSNGYLLCAQGQKLMVRGLKEDLSLLPVAFMDVNAYVSSVRNLDGMVLLGDVVKSVQFAGFAEEPYKLAAFGKDTQAASVVAAEFLPADGGKLLFVVADARGRLLVLEYDPEHPKSLAGQRLIRRAAFNVGHEIATLTLLPRTPAGHVVLLSTRTGALATLATTAENEHRRLNVLQTQIVAGGESVGGLNHKAWRHVESEGLPVRSVLDAAVVGAWCGLGVGRRREVGVKAGMGG
ncbi:CPSF A subunit region-domain-containing protein, partial [Geopyxis carbonaria]